MMCTYTGVAILGSLSPSVLIFCPFWDTPEAPPLARPAAAPLRTPAAVLRARPACECVPSYTTHAAQHAISDRQPRCGCERCALTWTVCAARGARSAPPYAGGTAPTSASASASRLAALRLAPFRLAAAAAAWRAATSASRRDLWLALGEERAPRRSVPWRSGGRAAPGGERAAPGGIRAAPGERRAAPRRVAAERFDGCRALWRVTRCAWRATAAESAGGKSARLPRAAPPRTAQRSLQTPFKPQPPKNPVRGLQKKSHVVQSKSGLSSPTKACQTKKPYKGAAQSLSTRHSNHAT